MNHLNEHPELMMGLIMFGVISLVALITVALAEISRENGDGQ